MPDTVSLTGRTAIVTGANTGIGRVTALELAKLGAHVILAGRSLERTEPVLAEIAASKTTNGAAPSCEFLKLDLGSFASTRAAVEVLLQRAKPVELLINNAGLAGNRGLTEDGFEMTFGTNHLGPFLFTQKLMPLILKASEPRIVNVSSRAHFNTKSLSYDAVKTSTVSKTGMREYSFSKLANVLHALELHRLYGGQGLKSYSLHPGVVASDVWRAVPWPFRGLIKLFMISNEEGARTTLHCATHPDAQSGLFYNKEKPQKASILATEEAAKDLWKRSEAWTTGS
jgi:retinol dehydrogenase 12